jgi:hypothetical protein
MDELIIIPINRTSPIQTHEEYRKVLLSKPINYILLVNDPLLELIDFLHNPKKV